MPPRNRLIALDTISEIHEDVRRHLANVITAARGLCGPIVAVLLLGFELNFVAFWVFVFAVSTDLIDGKLARSSGVPNPIGKWLDPAADKLLTDFTWTALWLHGWAPTWLFVASVGRDLLVVAVSAWLTRRNVGLEPNHSGQIMVAFEGVALSVLLFHGPWNGTHWPSVGVTLGIIALVLSAASAIGYLQQLPTALASTAVSREPPLTGAQSPP